MAPTVDAHHHFWDPARADYPWLTGVLSPVRRAFGPADMAPSLAARGVDRTVLVQCRPSVEETREFLVTAEATAFIAGVVGWVDLTDPGAADEIARLRSGPGGRWLVGIRHQVQDEPDPDWLGRAAVRAGIAAVGAAGLVYDLLIRPEHLTAAADLARAQPDTRFLVDHLAKPPIASGALEPWSTQIRPLGELGNVSCKLSGMVTEADLTGWRPDDLRPYVDHVLDVFGPARLVFGSDWPLSLVAGTYERVYDAASETLDSLSVSERAAVFGANATEVYGLTEG